MGRYLLALALLVAQAVGVQRPAATNRTPRQPPDFFPLAFSPPRLSPRRPKTQLLPPLLLGLFPLGHLPTRASPFLPWLRVRSASAGHVVISGG